MIFGNGGGVCCGKILPGGCVMIGMSVGAGPVVGVVAPPTGALSHVSKPLKLLMLRARMSTAITTKAPVMLVFSLPILALLPPPPPDERGDGAARGARVCLSSCRAPARASRS